MALPQDETQPDAILYVRPPSVCLWGHGKGGSHMQESAPSTGLVTQEAQPAPGLCASSLPQSFPTLSVFVTVTV